MFEPVSAFLLGVVVGLTLALVFVLLVIRENLKETEAILQRMIDHLPESEGGDSE